MKAKSIGLAGLVVACLATMLLLPAIADEAGSCAKPGLVLEPIGSTHTIVQYPRESVLHNEQGITLLSVSIGTDGIPNHIGITRSSGSERLDDAITGHIKEHWRWHPPTQDCRPTAAQAPVTVIWHQRVVSAAAPNPDFHVKMPPSAYPPGAAEKLEDGYTLLEVETDEQGAVAGGRVIVTSGYSDLDDQALAIMKNSPALLKGQTAGKHILSVDWEPPPANFPKGETVIILATVPAR